MVPCAYLRVFEPLDAFPAYERERWGRYVADGRGLTVRAALQAESKLAAARLVTRRAPVQREVALVRRVGRRIHVCPLQLAERHAVALLAFQETLPESVVPAFLSRDEARASMAAVERLRRPPHIQESSWEVPLRWFAAFAADERHFVDPPEGLGPRLTYLTQARAALRRLRRVTALVETAIEGGDELSEALADLQEWLASFHEDSLLELDYGGLTRLIPRPDLVIDTSCRELWDAIACLERGETNAAMSGYEALSTRWQMLRQRCQVN